MGPPRNKEAAGALDTLPTAEEKKLHRDSGATANERKPLTVEQMAAAAGVGKRTMEMALLVRRDGCAELMGAVVKGALSVNQAAQLCGLTGHDGQRVFLEESAGMTAHERAGYLGRVRTLALQRGEVA